AHSCSGRYRNAWSRRHDRSGAFHPDVEWKLKTNRIGARSDQAVDMIEAGRFDANERFADLQRPKILDGDGEHLGSARAMGSSNATLDGNTFMGHRHNVSNCLYCVSLHFPTRTADEQTKAFAQKNA